MAFHELGTAWYPYFVPTARPARKGPAAGAAPTGGQGYHMPKGYLLMQQPPPCPCGNPYQVGVTCCYRARVNPNRPRHKALQCNVAYMGFKPSWRLQQNGGYTPPKQAMRPNQPPQYINCNPPTTKLAVSSTPVRRTPSALHA